MADPTANQNNQTQGADSSASAATLGTPVDLGPNATSATLPSFSTQDKALVQLPDGTVASGSRANLPNYLKANPGAKEIQLAPDEVVFSLPNGSMVTGSKAGAGKFIAENPKAKLEIGDLSGVRVPKNVQPTPQMQEQQRILDKEDLDKSTGVMGVAVGAGKGALDTVQGASHLINKVAPGSVQEPTSSGINLEATTPSQSTGKFVENIGEFIAGDEALKGLSVAEKVGLAGKVADIAKTSPKIAKALDIGMNSVRAGVVGGAQGGVKGAETDQVLEGAEGGALGGFTGNLAGESATKLAGAFLKPILERVGIGTDALSDAAKGAKPGKRNYRFAQDFMRAAPYLDRENALDPNASVKDWADSAQSARENLYSDQIQPLVDRHATEPLGGLNIADSIRKQIPDAMKKFKPEEAKKMEELANQFLPGQKFSLTVQEAEDALQHFNADLSSTGFWSKTPAEREALRKTDGHIAGLKAAADGIRDELYGKLEELEPGSNVADLKKDYGALRNVENELRGQVNVQGRQSPVSLKEAVGIIAGIGHGGLAGLAMAGVPIADRAINAPEVTFSRGVRKAVHGEPFVDKAARLTGKAANAIIPRTTTVGGSLTGQSVAVSQIPDSFRSQLKEGVYTTAANHQVWTLQNGQPVRIR